MVSLLDINVLVTLIWEPHVHHAAASRWFLCRAGQDGMSLEREGSACVG